MKFLQALALVTLLAAAGLGSGAPLETGFTYQGELVQNGTNVTDNCDFRFGLWDEQFAGAQLGDILEEEGVFVDDGVFSVYLDFGPFFFDGNQRFLEIEVRCPAGDGAYTTLAGRQEVTPTPIAIYSIRAGAVDWGGISNIPPDIADGDDVDDADSDPANEIQELDLSGDTLSLSGDISSVDLSKYLDNSNCVLGECLDPGRASLTCGDSSIELNCHVAGAFWAVHGAAEANGWRSVAYGNKLFVAVSDSGTNRVMTSPDGIVWTPRSATEDNVWTSVTFGNEQFVAVSFDGTNQVMTSPDGITWTARSAAIFDGWRAVAYGGGQYVAISGSNSVMTSPDGITWTDHLVPGGQWKSMAHGGGLFVAVSSGGLNQVMTSPDGIAWTSRIPAGSNDWVSVTYGDGLFVAVAFNGANPVMTSPDGITWTARSAHQAFWESVTFGGGQFVAVGSSGSTNRVMTSPDGIAWTARSAAEANGWVSVAYGAGRFVAVALVGINRVMTSPGN